MIPIMAFLGLCPQVLCFGTSLQPLMASNPGPLLSGPGGLLLVILDLHLVGAGDHTTATGEGYTLACGDQVVLLR